MAKFPSFRMKSRMVVAPPASTSQFTLDYERPNSTTGQPEKVELTFPDKPSLDQFVNNGKTKGEILHHETYEIPGKTGVMPVKTGLFSKEMKTTFVPTGEPRLVDKE